MDRWFTLEFQQANPELIARLEERNARNDPRCYAAAYRVLAQKYHPDLNPSPDAANAMRRLNAAYEILGDTTGRRQYDGARVTGMGSATGAGYDQHFADRATAQAEAAHPTDRRGPSRHASILGVRPFSRSKSGKAGLWLGMCLGLLVLLILVSDVT